jgi:shikimate kinase
MDRRQDRIAGLHHAEDRCREPVGALIAAWLTEKPALSRLFSPLCVCLLWLAIKWLVNIEDEKRNVYLVGLMGAGKTTIAKALAKRLAYQFRRLRPRNRGAYRRQPADDLRDRRRGGLSQTRSPGHRRPPLCAVVSWRPAAVPCLRAENRASLQGSGLVIYLNVPLQTLCERTRHDKNRPLLRVSDPLQKLKELHQQRDPLYREASPIWWSAAAESPRSRCLQLLLKKLEKPWKR